MSARYFSLTLAGFAILLVALIGPSTAEANIYELNGIDSFGQAIGLGGVLSGTIVTNGAGIVISADVFDTATGNALENQPGVIEYTFVNSSVPNDGLGFGLTSSSVTSSGVTQSYDFDNLWFALGAALDTAPVINLLPWNHGGLGDPTGSVRADIYYDDIAITGTLTEVPEPSSLALLGAGGLVALGFLRRRSVGKLCGRHTVDRLTKRSFRVTACSAPPQ